MASRRPIRTKEIQSPERILNNLLRDYVDGNLDDYTFLYRASVVKIDHLGGGLETQPPNPKNSIQARIITNARDKILDDTELPVFYPLFPHDIMPVKEGEHIYVIFEDAAEKTHGIWLCRIPDPNDTENTNLVPGIKKYQDNPDNDMSSVNPEQAVQDTDSAPTSVVVSSDFVTETVPKFRARVGDRVVEGSNNTAIVLGRDRPSNFSSGETSAAGTIDIVAGRSAEEDMDMAEDKSRVYVSMNTDIDGNLSIKVGPSSGPSAAIGVKSDQIRIVARNGMKLVVEGGDIHIDGANIFIGDQASQSVPLGEELKKYLETVVVSTPAGPGKLAPPPPTILSKTVKVKS